MAPAAEWRQVPFQEALQRVNGKPYQVEAAEYRETGEIPVVDQGKSLLAGFSDRHDKRFRVPPGGLIVFGDHTRIVKFVDFDFVVGADGTQLMVGRPGFSTRLLAYVLQHHEVPNTGYNRHFKFLLDQVYFLPSDLVEQEALACALSDVDALLAKLDQLIAKKRDLKQAAMQQLLMGRTRLPGFANEWTGRSLGSVLSICHGRSQRDVESPDGRYPILATGGQIGTASTWLYDKPSVLIGRKGTIDRPQYMETPFWTVDTLFYSAMRGANCAKFFYYRFCLIDWAKYNEASGVPSLNARTIEAIEVDCPEPSEQVAVAQVLSDMDTELAALEARRDKTRQLKQGMMQALLTGRIRLV